MVYMSHIFQSLSLVMPLSTYLGDPGASHTFLLPPSTRLYVDSLHFVRESGSLSWPWGICMLVCYLSMSSMPYCSQVWRLADILLVIHFQWLFVSSVSCRSRVGQQWFTLNLCGHLDFNILFLKCGILPFADCDSLSPKSNILLFLSSASCCSLVRTTNLPIEARGITSQGESPPSISSPSTFSSPFTHFLCASCMEMFSSTFHDHRDWGVCTMYVLP